MNRNGFVYKIAKKCEKPSEKMPWSILHKLFMGFCIIYGKKVYSKIQKDTDGRTILYYYSISMGDYFLFSLVVDDFWKHSKIDSYCLVVPDCIVKLCDSLKYDKVYPLSFPKFTAMNIYLNFSRSDKKAINFFPWLFFKTKEYKVKPNVCLKIDEIIDIQEFKELGLEEKNTVVLAPYEKSLSIHGFPILPSSFWELLTKKLHDRGYKVCTNCDNSESQKPVKGTIPVLPKYGEIMNFCETCGYVVAIRSGFADMCTFSNCKKIILYPNQKAFSMWPIKESFGMNQNICELIYDNYLETLDYSLIDCIVEEIENDKKDI